METMKKVEKRPEVRYAKGIPYTVTGKTAGQLTVNVVYETKKGCIPLKSTIIRVKNRKDFNEDMMVWFGTQSSKLASSVAI